MRLVPYLNFNGDCREAFDYYHKVFGGEEPTYFRHADIPMDDLPDGWGDKILHAHLEINGQSLMASDVPADTHRTPASMFVSIQHSDPVESERYFHALAEGGTVTMPWGNQPWGSLFGICIDRFGIPWMINCDQHG